MIFLLALLLAELGPQTVKPPGTSAPAANAVQGVTGGVALHVACDSGCGGAATFADNGVFTAGSTTVNITAGVFNDSIADLTSGSAGAPRLTSKRALHFNMRTNAGVEVPFPAALDADLGFKVHVQNTVTVTDTHTTAAVPLSLRLSDGAAFYDGTKTGQLPAALDGSGFLKVHEQGTASTNVAQLAGTTTDTNSGLKSAGTLRVVLATDQPALTNKLLVTPDSVALPANQSVNVTQWSGTASVTGSGTATGALRVELANNGTGLVGLNAGTALVGKVGIDQTTPGTTNAVQDAATSATGSAVSAKAGFIGGGAAAGAGNLTGATVKAGSTVSAATDTAVVVAVRDAFALTANQSVNLAQVGGTNTLTGGTNGSLGVGGLAADGSAVSGNPVAIAGKGFNGISFMPRYCDKLATVTTLSTTVTVQQIAAVATQKIYICGYYILASTATTAVTLKWTEGTGSNCVTGLANVTPAIFTTPTAAPTTANFTLGPWGNGAIPWMVTAGDALCITQSSGTNATTLSGVIFYTQN